MSAVHEHRCSSCGVGISCVRDGCGDAVTCGPCGYTDVEHHTRGLRVALRFRHTWPHGTYGRSFHAIKARIHIEGLRRAA